MDGLQPEDALILGVGLIIVLNRAFTATSIKLQRWAYVAIQIFNLATMAVLLQFQLVGYPPKLAQAIRVFLMFFVAWHMVLANQGRAQALRQVVDDRREADRKADERAERLEKLDAWDEAVKGKDSAPDA
jgi:hypothetical protein